MVPFGTVALLELKTTEKLGFTAAVILVGAQLRLETRKISIEKFHIRHTMPK